MEETSKKIEEKVQVLPLKYWPNRILDQKVPYLTDQELEDVRNNRPLKTTNQPIQEVLVELQKLMLNTMKVHRGVGLASPQVGFADSPFFVILNDSEELGILNPTVITEGFKTDKVAEGCLSFPGVYMPTERFTECILKGFDIKGLPVEYHLKSLPAVAAQHEWEHLQGIHLATKLSSLKKDILKRKLQKHGKPTRTR